METTIREATIKDYKKINDLYKELDAFHIDMKPSRLKDSGNFGRTKDYFEGIINDKSSTILVATTGSEVIGFVELGIKKEPENNFLKAESFVEIEYIEVKEKYRNSGVGGILIQSSENWARKNNINILEVNAHFENKLAQDFYHRYGYSITDVNLRKYL